MVARVGPRIANSSVSASAISADELKNVFVKEYLGKTDSALQTYYRSLVFTGKASMPKMLGADAEVVTYVAKTKGAIGYVSAGTSAEGVKTLEVK